MSASMHISITGRRLPITTALRDYIERKLGKLQKYTHRSIEANIILGVEKYRHRAEILFHINNHRILVKEETNEMYQSIDKAVAKIEMRFKKHKGKITKHH
ncbi:MAG: ribosome-associated translation inhibitor RaiA, partial [Proteobacteria bacterium]|nr:ribosome-associated translation inhibitor RaiA [Pseudomonadota bacterium]